MDTFQFVTGFNSKLDQMFKHRIPQAELNTRGRKGHEARDVAIYLSREMTMESLTEIGNHFEGIRPSAVGLAHRRIADRMQEDHEVGRRMEDLSHRIRA